MTRRRQAKHSAGRAAIVGAGAAGLVSARELGLAGFEVDLFEAQDRVGGVWIYRDEVESDPLSQRPDRRRVHSSLYRSMRTNLPRDLMAFRSFPFPGEPRFPGHEEVLDYLERFAETNSLTERIRFRTRVRALNPVAGPSGEEGWTIELGADESDPRAAGASDSKRAAAAARENPPEWVGPYDAVVVASGHYSTPRLPELPGLGTFAGEALHSHNYRCPEPFAGRKVVVVGSGSSAVDLSLELEPGSDVRLSVRDAVLGSGAFRSLCRRGLEVRGEVAEVIGSDRLRYSDGSVESGVDVLLFCTGYRYSYPFLDHLDVIQVQSHRVKPLYLDLVPPAHPTLAFVGLPYRVVPFPLFELQAQWFAAFLRGRVPRLTQDEMESWIERREEALRAQGVEERRFLDYGDDQFTYNDALADQLGIDRLPFHFRSLYREAGSKRIADPAGYRDQALEACLAESLAT